MQNLLSGLLFGLSLIVVIGAQNTYVLRQGILRQKVALIVTICTISDMLLIAAGVAGTGAVLEGRHELLVAVRIAGAGFLFAYGALAVRRVRRPPTASNLTSSQQASAAAVLVTCLALTWLNPGVYLDSVVVLGSIAHARPGDPWWFASGAMCASLVWFVALGFGARYLTALFRRPGVWRVLDGSVAVIMLLTGLRVLFEA
jgi:L-lysine exporter family protein LysE/ArgO